MRVFPDPHALGEAAGTARGDGVLVSAIAARGVAHAMFATGNSQFDFLDALVLDDSVDWSRVIGFHMDEYVGIAADHPASFRRYLRERLVERVPICGVPLHRRRRHRYRRRVRRGTPTLLREHPLDLCCLGIGENGHLAFNDPPVADFDDPLDVKVVELDDACRRQQVGEGHFPDVDAVPTHAITVTIPALLRASTVLAIVPEARKAEPVRRALGRPDRRPPARRRSCARDRTPRSTSTPGPASASAMRYFFDGTEGRCPVR